MVSVSNIRDMLAADQEELVKAYIHTYSSEMEKDGVKTVLNPDKVSSISEVCVMKVK